MAKLLQHHQSNSPIGRDENSVPHIFLTRALNFASFVSIFSPTDRSYEASLFRLGHALFDETDLRLGESASTTTRNRIASLRRKTAVSAWLEDVVSPSVDADLRKASSADNAAACFTYLTGNQVEKACDAAIAGHNFMLSTLVSQASGGGSEFQTDLRAQLEIWRDQRIDVHIGEDVRKVYALLAGIVDTLEGSKGTGLEKCPDMLIHKDLDWKRIYGLHLWYSEPGEASLGTVFRSFDEFWQSTKTASPPKAPHQPTYWNVPSKPPPLDAPFSLLKLQADPTCSLSQTLTPLSFSSSPIDYCFPWHLYTILSRCMRVRDFADRSDHGVGNLSGDMDVDRSGDAEDEGALWGEGHSPTADLVACSYAFQLECLGMIQQAAFVLLHIEEVNG
jgi:nuclear pore complex protein Nup98-Nup96